MVLSGLSKPMALRMSESTPERSLVLVRPSSILAALNVGLHGIQHTHSRNNQIITKPLSTYVQPSRERLPMVRPGSTFAALNVGCMAPSAKTARSTMTYHLLHA